MSRPLIIARYLKPVPTLQLIAPCLLLAALVYAPAAAVTRPSELPSTEVLASLAGLGVICTALAFVVFLELIREAGPTRAVVFTYVNPAVAVTAGVLFLNEELTAGVVAAFTLILLGSFLATAASKPAIPSKASTASPASGAGGGAGGAGRPVPWSTRQTSRADGRVEVLADLPEERPGSTGQGGG